MNQIPEMTHPLGRSWRQPNKDNIVIDDHHALMSDKDFKKLYEYNTSFPSGVYPGKMWKRQITETQWMLLWYDFSDKGENYCSTKTRKIIIEGGI